MQTIKKKNVKKYQFTDLIDSKEDLENDDLENDELELDELVSGTGAPISGDEKNASNSEIKTAPQATTNDFADVAIQPNRYLYNAGGSGYSRGAAVNAENVDKLAKFKMFKLLENLSTEEPIVDRDENQISDIKQLPQNIANKLEGLTNTLDGTHLSDVEIKSITDYVMNSLRKLSNDA